MTNAGSSGAAVLFATFRGALVNASLVALPDLCIGSSGAATGREWAVP